MYTYKKFEKWIKWMILFGHKEVENLSWPIIIGKIDKIIKRYETQMIL